MKKIVMLLVVFVVSPAFAQIMSWENSPYNYNNSPLNYQNSPLNTNSKNGVYDNNGNRIGYSPSKQK